MRNRWMERRRQRIMGERGIQADENRGHESK